MGQLTNASKHIATECALQTTRKIVEKPENYDQYELLARILDDWKEVFWKFDRIDTNNNGPFSTDNIGMNYDYPEASYKRRLEILEEHTTYQGLLWFYANDERVPEAIRTKMQTWGLAKMNFGHTRFTFVKHEG